MAGLKESWSLEWLAAMHYMLSLSEGMRVISKSEDLLELIPDVSTGLDKIGLPLTAETRSKLSQLRSLSEQSAQLAMGLRATLLMDYIDVSRVSYAEMILMEVALSDNAHICVVSSRLEEEFMFIEFFFESTLHEIQIPCRNVEEYRKCYSKLTASKLLFEGYQFTEIMGSGQMIMVNRRGAEFIADFRRRSCDCREYIDQRSCRHLRFADTYVGMRNQFTGIVKLAKEERTLMELT